MIKDIHVILPDFLPYRKLYSQLVCSVNIYIYIYIYTCIYVVSMDHFISLILLLFTTPLIADKLDNLREPGCFEYQK